MKYPKYPRKWDRRCKLSLHQIKKIRKEYAKGHKMQKELAAEYKVSPPAIWFILLSKEEYKILNKLKYARLKRRQEEGSYKPSIEARRKYQAARQRRKRALQIKEIRRYYNSKNRALRKKKKDLRS